MGWQSPDVSTLVSLNLMMATVEGSTIRVAEMAAKETHRAVLVKGMFITF